MANYFIGDIQGCFDELQALLEVIAFTPECDTLWFTGDLVARGPKSLETLRFVRSLGPAAHTVLGNHDLHLLAVAAGIKPVNKADHLAPLLDAPDRQSLIDWLRQQPLLIHLPEHQLLLCHAGIPPQWDLATAIACARAVEARLRAPDYLSLITQMYGNEPRRWHPGLSPIDQCRFTINSLTRMRFCHADGSLDFNEKCAPGAQRDPALAPWFEHQGHCLEQVRIAFGHWASLLGHSTHQNAIALDTGCLWGHWLTAWRVEDGKRFVQKRLI